MKVIDPMAIANKTKTILIIADSNDLRDLLENVSQPSTRLLWAHNGLTGIRMAFTHDPDLIVCDLQSNADEGYKVIQALQAKPHTQIIPFIFVSNNRSTSFQRKAILMGADDFLAKPMKPADLLAAIEIRLTKQALVQSEHQSTMKALRANIIYALPHEFRTPLTSILGYAHLLESDYTNVKPSFIREAAETIMKSGTRLHELVENYLTYAQLELIASDPAQLKALNNHLLPCPADIIGAIAESIAQKAKRSDDLTLDLQEHALRISDENLTKLMTELIDNAFKFSDPGTPVKVKSRHKDNQYMIYIADQGRGLSSKQVKEMGEYMQFGRALHEQQGLGLGFAVAQRLVELHCGSLEINSKLDKGTILTITFPL